MKYLQNSDGDTIEIPNDVYLTKGLISFFDFSVKGEYSTDFEIPNDSQIRKALGYYSLNQSDRITKKSFSFYVDGNKVSSGLLYIRSVSDVFDLFYIGGNANWLNLIQGSIKDLDLSEYDLIINAVTINDRKTATDGIIFPVIDWAYNNKKIDNTFYAKTILGVGQDGYFDFYPCMHVHTIVKKILITYGLKFGGNLKDDPVFNDLVITPEDIAYESYTSGVNQYSEESMTYDDPSLSFILENNDLKKMPMDSGGNLFDDVRNRLVMDQDYTKLRIDFGIAINEYEPFLNGQVHLYKNGVSIKSKIPTVLTVWLEDSVVVSGVAGDYFELWFENQTVTPKRYREGYVTINLINDVNVFSSNIIPNISQFEFIQYVATRFNCLLDYEPGSKTVVFTKLDSILKQDAQDLSESLLTLSQIPSSGYAKNNYLRTVESEELIGYKTEELAFGDKLITSDGDGYSDVFVTPFRPSESFINQNLEWLMTSIPLIRLEDSGQGFTFGAVANSIAFPGKASFELDAPLTSNIDGYVVRVETNAGETNEYNGFFVVDSGSATLELVGGVDYIGNSSGTIYLQRIVFQKGSRELIVVRDIEVNDINTGSHVYGDINIKMKDTNGTYPQATIAWAYFAKPNISTDLDNYKVGLNYGSVLNTANIPFSELYHRTLVKIVQGPKAKATFMLSQSQYLNLSLSQFVYLKTKDAQGYYLIANIDGYRDQYTPVEADLILIS